MTRPPTIRTHLVANKGGGKGGVQGSQPTQHTPVESPNTLRSDTTARIMEVIGEGVIKGLHTGDFQSVFLDGTPILNPDGSSNFNVPQTDIRIGLPDQDPIPGFSAAESEISVGVELIYNIPIVRRLTAGVDAVRTKVRVPALYYQQDNGDVVSATAWYRLEYSIGGGAWIWAFDDTISGKTMSPYERAVRYQLPKTSAPIDIRLTRINAPAGAALVINEYFSSYTEIVDANVKYDDTAVVAMVVDAQFFPSVPQRAYLIDGLLIKVPSNYDPIARTYAGDWDGTFKVAWSNNPAWVLYDLLTNDRYGVGRQINASMVDKWSFYEAAIYNDGWLDDGYGTGGIEPRFTFNGVINTQQDAFTVLNAVASTMRALLYYSNGTIFLVQDRQQPQPTRIYGPANVIDGLFDYTGTDFRSLFNAVGVTWNDPAEQYNQNVELVTDGPLISQQGYRATAKAAYGCTSRGQAIRFGRWTIFTAQNETEAVTFRVSLEDADVRPGEVVAISDPSRVGARMAGRTLDWPTPGELKLDAAVGGVSNGWNIYLTSGNTITEHTIIATYAADHFAVTNLATPPEPGTMWLAHNSAIVEPTQWRVVSIKDNGQSQYEILGAQYQPTKYAYIDFNLRIPPAPTSLIPTGPLGNAINPSKTEYIYVDPAGTIQFGVIVSWQPSPDPRVAYYKVELSGPGGDYRAFSHVVGLVADNPAMRDGQYTVAFTSFDNLGRRSIPLYWTFTTVGLTAVPLPPAALYATVQGQHLQLEWLPTGEIDVLYYWLRWHPSVDPDIATWAKATTVGTRVSRNTTHAVVPTRTGTYFCKTIDSLGQESDTAASDVIYDIVEPFNDLTTLIEEPAWAGSLDLWEIEFEEIFLMPPLDPEDVPPTVWPGPRGTTINSVPTRQSYYGFANSYDMGAVGSMQLTAIVEAYGSYGDNAMHTWVPLASAKPLALGASSQWEATIEVALSQDGVTFGDYQPITAAAMKGQAVRARLSGVLYDTQTWLRCVRCELQIQAPERDLKGTTAIGSDGTAHIDFDPHFYETPNLGVSAHAPIGTPLTVNITAADKNGFSVVQHDRNGNVVGGGTFDWRAQGFGVSA